MDTASHPTNDDVGGRRRAELLADGDGRSDIRRRLRHEELRHLAHGIYLADGPAAPLVPSAPLRSSVDRAVLQTLTRDGPHVVSHRTAAAVWDLGGAVVGPPYHLTTPRGRARVRRPGLIVAHRVAVPEEFILDVGGIPVTSPAWTWVDLALEASLLGGIILADQVLRPPRPVFEARTTPLARPEDLQAALRRRTKAKGIRTARQAAELARVGVDSAQETRLRHAMWRAGLPEPQVNPVIRDDRGRILFVPDLAVEEFRVAIQYEGEEVHSTPGRVIHDVTRGERTEGAGWLEVRITKEHSRDDWRPATGKIAAALRSRGWTPPSDT